jgi:hypothetical protein
MAVFIDVTSALSRPHGPEPAPVLAQETRDAIAQLRSRGIPIGAIIRRAELSPDLTREVEEALLDHFDAAFSFGDGRSTQELLVRAAAALGFAAAACVVVSDDGAVLEAAEARGIGAVSDAGLASRVVADRGARTLVVGGQDLHDERTTSAMNELAAAAEAATALASSDSLIAALQTGISPRDIREVVSRYSGAAALGSTSAARVRSRHAAHRDNERVVAQLVQDCTVAPNVVARPLRFWFDAVGGYRSNVEVRFTTKAKPEAVFLVTAHLDSTAKSESGYNSAVNDAPGADDNASGIGGLLAIARTLNRLEVTAESKCEIRLVLFNGEENGFTGSTRYLETWPSDGPAILGAIQLDMIGYRSRPLANGTHPFEIHAYAAQSPSATAWSLAIANVIRCLTPKVAPELAVQVYPGDLNSDPGQGRSDHASFHRKHIGAVAISEDVYPGPDATSPPPSPNRGYHRYTDRVESIDAGYAAAISRVAAATAIIIARTYDARHRAVAPVHPANPGASKGTGEACFGG